MTPEQLLDEVRLAVDVLESIVTELVESIGPPLAIATDKALNFQYPKRTPEVVQVLKAVRVVSGLDACCVLLASGHTSESAVVARTVADGLQEIMFLMERDDKGALNDRQTRFVADFFAQPVPTPEQIAVGMAKPPTVPKAKIQAAIARLYGPLNDGDTSSVQRWTKNMDIVASGFVHLSYRSIMETYKGGMSDKVEGFYMRGLPGTPRIGEHTRYIAGVAISAICQLGALALLLGQTESYEQLKPALDRLWSACDEFDKESGRQVSD